MSRIIRKYILGSLKTNVAVLNMPEDAKILDARLQNGIVVLWAVVKLNERPVVREFVIVFTDEPLPKNKLKYVSTIEARGEDVLHLFEVIPKRKRGTPKKKPRTRGRRKKRDVYEEAQPTLQ